MTEVVTVLFYGRGRIARVSDQNLLGADYDLNCVFERINVELPIHGSELHEVQGGEVAGGVVEKHVLRTRVGRVDPIRVRAWVPLVDYRIKLDSGVAADVSSLSHLSHQTTGLVHVRDLMVCDVPGLPLLVLCHGVHELVRNTDAVVRVLEEDGAVGFAVDGPVVACVD